MLVVDQLARDSGQVHVGGGHKQSLYKWYWKVFPVNEYIIVSADC
jgi:hypothetical protein